MTYTSIPSTSTDEDSPGDQTLMDLIRLNLDDHETRVSVLEDPAARVFHHFNEYHNLGSGIIVSATSGFYVDIFYLDVNFGTWVENISPSGTTFDHSITANLNSSNGEYAILNTTYAFNFGSVTKPIIFKSRVKWSGLNDVTAHWIGIARWGTAAGAPGRGVYMNRNGSNWRFSATDSSGTTHGTDFTPPTAGTWVDIEIRFEDDPGNQARCYVNGDLKETLSANLPTTETMVGTVRAEANAGSTGGTNIKVDRVEYKISAALGDAA